MSHLAAWFEEESGEASDSAGVCAALQDALAQGQTRWGFALDAETFVRFVGQRVAEGADPVEAIGALALDDLYLACACLEGDERAVEILESVVVAELPKAVKRIDSRPEFVREVVDELRVRLVVGQEGKVPRLARYQGRGSLRSFGMVLAMRSAVDHKRRAAKGEFVDVLELLQIPAAIDTADAGISRAELREPVARALKDALAALPVRERNVLRMHLVDEVSAIAIGRMYGVHRSTATRWITTAREQVLEFVRVRLMAELNLDSAAFNSLAKSLADGVELTLTTFLDSN
ncbi:MAG: sigma-70 family RNA polymerase sigma factor [Myxococcota bacterium]